MVKREQADAEKQEDQLLGADRDRLIAQLQHLLGRWRDVRRRIIGQEDAICEDGDDAGKLQTLCDKVADPWTQYHQADLCEDVLLGCIRLLPGRELLVSLVLLSDVAGLPLEDEGDEQG